MKENAHLNGKSVVDFCMLGILHVVCHLLIIFKINVFQKFFQEYDQSVCQTVWIQARPNKMSGLIWVQTVYKAYHQTTLVGKDLMHVLTKISA